MSVSRRAMCNVVACLIMISNGVNFFFYGSSLVGHYVIIYVVTIVVVLNTVRA